MDTSTIALCKQLTGGTAAGCARCGVHRLMRDSGMPEAELARLINPIRSVMLGPRQRLYEEGDTGSSAYSVRRGVVKLARKSDDGEVRIVRLCGQGTVIGLEAVLDRPYRHSADSVNETELCRIPVALILEMEAAWPPMRDSIAASLQEQTDAADAVITQYSTGTARQRLARLLLKLAGEEGGTRLHLSREEMAGLLGLTIETVSRTMSAFRREGIADDRRPQMEINARALQRISAGED
jgi:CRP-like cAMP-binding protein